MDLWVFSNETLDQKIEGSVPTRPSLRRTGWGRAWWTGSWGPRACSTTPSPPASSPDGQVVCKRWMTWRVSPWWGLPSRWCRSLWAPWCSWAAGSTFEGINVSDALKRNAKWGSWPSMFVCWSSYLGTRTVSILQSSLGSRSHSSEGMFCTRWRASSRQTFTNMALEADKNYFKRRISPRK